MRYLIFALLLSCAPGGLGNAGDADPGGNYHLEPPPIYQATTLDGSDV